MGIAIVKSVKKARKDQGECGGCGEPIKAGDAYRWWTVGFRSRYKNKRCAKCPLPPPSARESNPKISTVMAAQEAFGAAMGAAGDRDGFVSALTDYAEGIRDAASQWNESADEMESGFGHETEQSNEQRERGENAEAVADEIEQGAEQLDEEPEEGESPEDFIERLRDAAQAVYDDNEVECY